MAVNGIVWHVWRVTSPCFVIVMTSIIVVVATSIVVRVVVGVVVIVITLLWGHCAVAVVGVRVVWGHVAVVLVEVLFGIGACATWCGKAMWKK